LNGLAVPDVQLNHTSSFRSTMLHAKGLADEHNLSRIYTATSVCVQPR
jgi:hypothetical protein